jgi:hypothetical protein
MGMLRLAALRATQFYVGTPPAPGSGNLWTVVATVPAGKRWILKGVHMTNAGASTKVAGVRVDGTTNLYGPTMASAASLDFLPYIVLNPGQTLGVLQQAAGAIAYALSGFQVFI